MRKFTLFAAVIAFAGIFLCGCSNPEEDKAKANAALYAEVKEILETIHIVDKGVLSAVDRGDILNSEIMIILDKYKRLCELTGLKFYSWVLSDVDNVFFTAEQYQKLTERTPKLIPFYIEDEISGTLYFAPPPEQEFIIGKYREWFAKNGEKFDYDAMLKARNTTK